MALISIILGLFLDRTFRHLHDLRDMAWFEHYSQTIQRFAGTWFPPLQFVVILALPVSLLLGIQILLDDFLFNLPGFIFGVIIFIYCLGPACLTTDIEAYIHARSVGDEDEALHYAGTITGTTASASPDNQISDVTRAILYVANERIFATIVWFVILGPFGAILYRLISELSKQIETNELSEFAEFIHAIMAWAPARMLSAGYALTGNFDGAYHAYRERAHTFNYQQSNNEVLTATGLGAMRNMELESETTSIHTARALVMRATVAWIGILAVMTLGGILN